MVRNEQLYQQALEFRKRGFTYSEIAKICSISKSTVSNWFSNQSFSKKVAKDNACKAARDNVKRLSLLNKARTAERKNRYIEAERSAETEFKHYKKDPLFIAGVILYLTHGDKVKERTIRLTSHDVASHRIFVNFVTTYLGVPKSQIKFWLLLYPKHREVDCMKYWSRKIGISVASFYKNQIVPGKSSRSTLQYGVGNTIIGSTVLKRKLNRWLELTLKEL